MKKKIGISVLIIILAFLAWYAWILFNKSQTGTLSEDSRLFKYEDTSNVTRIFIADKSGRKAELSRDEKNQWLINGKYPARPDAIASILKCLLRLEVKSTVGEKRRPFILKDLAAHGIKAEFYSGDKAVRMFYVGGETQDHTGTYMLLVNHKTGENFEQPYVMELPGFEGYLTPRFMVNEKDWRDTKCLDFIPPQITEVKFEITGSPDSSFLIRLIDTKNFQLLSTDAKPLNVKADVNSIKQYLAYLQNLHYEKLLDNDKVVDSIRNTIPFATLSINDKKGKQHQYLFFHKKISKGQKDKYGIDSPFDPDRLYMEFDDRSQFALIQFYVFGKLLQTRSYFITR
ncbi:MAG: DUF4340 domain-containing protein [Bacteroidota bacterium]|jgi:hypothetical protein